MSKHLSRFQIKGLEKMGNQMLPGDGEFASFAVSGCSSEVDRILDKINSDGFGSLSAEEKKVLDEARDLIGRR